VGAKAKSALERQENIAKETIESNQKERKKG